MSQCAPVGSLCVLRFTVTIYSDDFFAIQLKEHLVSRVIIRSGGGGLTREIERVNRIGTFSLSLPETVNASLLLGTVCISCGVCVCV